MGDFSVTCGASGISLFADRAALIPLIQPAPFIANGPSIISNEGVHELFHALTLPVFGEIDGYGKLENIEHNKNTECIEKFFGMSIEDFCEAISSGEDVQFDINSYYGEKRNIKAPFCGMFVHRDIYDYMANNFKHDYYGKDMPSIWDHGDITTYVLALMGFKFVEEVDNIKERYNKLHKHPLFPEIGIWSDGRWLRTEFKGKYLDEGIYEVSSLVEYIEKKTKRKFPQKTIKKLKSIKWTLVSIREKRLEIIANKRRHGGEKADKNTKRLMALLRGQCRLALQPTDSNYGAMLYDALYEKSFRKIVNQHADFAMFCYNLYAMNRLLMPNLSGYQYGNHFMALDINKQTVKILSAKVKEQNDAVEGILK